MKRPLSAAFELLTAMLVDGRGDVTATIDGTDSNDMLLDTYGSGTAKEWWVARSCTVE